MPSPEDPRCFYPAAERNREPILSVLRRVLPWRGAVLEIASGSGQHVAHFAHALRGLVWQPSECDERLLSSIQAWADGRPNVREPRLLDVEQEPWPVSDAELFDAIYNANLIHISPWSTCQALLRGAGAHLRDGGMLAMYGPFKIDGAHTAPSNAAFDASLRQRDPRWGVRALEDVRNAAAAEGLVFEERVSMPANNQILLFKRQK